MDSMRRNFTGIFLLTLMAGLASGQSAQPPQEQPATEKTAKPKPSAQAGAPGDTNGETNQETPAPSAKDTSAKDLPPSEPAPRSDSGDASTGMVSKAEDFGTFSSSRESIIDLRPPQGDAKEHPNSAEAISRATGNPDEDADGDVREFHEWNPMMALKDIEVGDYYFKRKNYKGALERYKHALVYKENDAVATFRLAVCQERMSDPSGALANYTAYLKILPNGPFADEAKQAIERLNNVPTGK